MRNRHEIREAAFQSLFALNANPEADHAAVYADVLASGEEVPDYLTELVDGVLAHQAELDEAISAKLKKGWTLSRLTKTDLIVLRLGLYEIQYETAMPDKAAINEALEIAKTYSDEQAAKFINGILGHFVAKA